MNINFEKFYKVLCYLRNMKKEIIFVAGLLLFLSLVSFASLVGATVGVCDDNQVIMRLYSSSNSHGALWNETNYNTKICWTDFFSPSYSGSSPHECNSNDVILKLYAVNNSHAADKYSSTYPISLCYKGLSGCEIATSQPNGKKAIVYLSGATNAHLSRNSALSYSAIYCKYPEEYTPIAPHVGPTGCYDFTFENDCNSAGDIAQSDPFCHANNGELCTCVWNGTKCAVQWTASGTWTSGSGFVGACDYTCIVSGSEATECSGGSQIISTLATLSPTGCSAPTGACQDSSATVSCGEIEASLPFFGSWQIISSLISIALVYALLGRKRLL